MRLPRPQTLTAEQRADFHALCQQHLGHTFSDEEAESEGLALISLLATVIESAYKE